MARISSILPFVAILMVVNGCSRPASNPLEGTWRMVSGTYKNLEEGQRIETEGTRRFSIKIMSPSHFAVVEMFRDKPDSLFFAAVGTYELTRDKYIEKYEASNVGYQVGTSREFDYTLEGDRWTIHTTTEYMELHEVWVRDRQR